MTSTSNTLTAIETSLNILTWSAIDQKDLKGTYHDLSALRGVSGISQSVSRVTYIGYGKSVTVWTLDNRQYDCPSSRQKKALTW